VLAVKEAAGTAAQPNPTPFTPSQTTCPLRRRITSPEPRRHPGCYRGGPPLQIRGGRGGERAYHVAGNRLSSTRPARPQCQEGGRSADPRGARRVGPHRAVSGPPCRLGSAVQTLGAMRGSAWQSRSSSGATGHDGGSPGEGTAAEPGAWDDMGSAGRAGGGSASGIRDVARRVNPNPTAL